MKLKTVEKAAAISCFPAFRIKFQSIQLFSSACATLVPFGGACSVAVPCEIIARSSFRAVGTQTVRLEDARILPFFVFSRVCVDFPGVSAHFISETAVSYLIT